MSSTTTNERIANLYLALRDAGVDKAEAAMIATNVVKEESK